jgi:hypothetical protein
LYFASSNRTPWVYSRQWAHRDAPAPPETAYTDKRQLVAVLSLHDSYQMHLWPTYIEPDNGFKSTEWLNSKKAGMKIVPLPFGSLFLFTNAAVHAGPGLPLTLPTQDDLVPRMHLYTDWIEPHGVERKGEYDEEEAAYVTSFIEEPRTSPFK